MTATENTILPLSYEQWFKRSSFKSGFNSLKSLNDFSDYQLNVEQHSASRNSDSLHMQDLTQSRKHNTVYDEKVYIPITGDQFVCEVSPRKGVMQLTNSDITILFDSYMFLNNRSLILILLGNAVSVIKIKNKFPIDKFKSVFASCTK